MSTDDFEARLRERLADLAEHDDDWADPLPAARRRAATPDPDDVGEVRPIPAARRRRWLPGLAVAAVVLGVLVGGGFGLRALVESSSGGSASSASEGGSVVADAGGDIAAPGAGSAAPGGGSAAPGGGNPAPGSSGTAGSCATPATSTGPLAAVASIRPSGIVGPRTTSGATVAVPYQLTFATAGGNAEVRPAQVVSVVDGNLCPSSGVASPGVVEAVPVAPGAGVSGTATFAAVDAAGSPLAAGRYQVVVVIAYSVDGSGLAQWVSTPVTVVVS